MNSDFLKRDDQILALRLQQEERLDRRKKAAVDLDRARAQNGEQGPFPDVDPDLDEDVVMDDMGENYGNKTVVIHIGSQNLRLGFATDALPKTVPMVIARKSDRTESEDAEPLPKRIKLDEDAPPEEWFGEEVGASDCRHGYKLTGDSLPKSTTRWHQSFERRDGRTNAESCPIHGSW